jgi:riboflavin kinase/FMN adenylyltransferase
MRIIETTADIKNKGCVLSIGNFDGVHMGHQEILATGRRIAAQKSTELAVLTFEPHPVAILHPEKAPGMLTPFELKKHLLAQCGVDCLIVLKDSAELLNLSAADFVEQFLVKDIGPSVVVEGEDFNFGVGRAGSVHTLYNLGSEKGFEVRIVESKEIKLSIGQSVKVSSTIIRNLLEAGKVADAGVALGRSYRLIGGVVAGVGKGKQLGFPTANIAPARQIIPVEGVYAGFVAIGDSEEDVCVAEEKVPGAISIGRAETLGGGQPLLIEAHLLIENVADLAGRWLAIDFIERIRSQQKFATEKELAQQIAKDCEKAREISGA